MERDPLDEALLALAKYKIATARWEIYYHAGAHLAPENASRRIAEVIAESWGVIQNMESDIRSDMNPHSLLAHAKSLNNRALELLAPEVMEIVHEEAPGF